MKIIVLGEDAIKKFQTDENHIVVSIRSPQTDPVELPKLDSRIGVQYLQFNDLDSNVMALRGIKLFNREDAMAILLFIEGMKSLVDVVVCQCEAGISRSAGVAGALSKIYNGTDEYFFKHYCPNMLVYRTILETYYEEKL